MAISRYTGETGQLRRESTHVDMPTQEEAAEIESALDEIPLTATERNQLRSMNVLELIELFSVIPLAELSQAGVLRDGEGFYLVNGSPLAKGGFGGVFKGFSALLRRSVALKSPLRDDLESLQKLKLEGQAQANEQHPNIISVLGFIPYAECTVPQLHRKPVLVMEYLDPQTAKRLDDFKDLHPLEIINIARQICDALAFLQKPTKRREKRAKTPWVKKDEGSSLLHLDLKPANIMVTADGTLKIGDFGIASSVNNFADRNEGNVGSPEWVSPERIHNMYENAALIPLDIQSELYSLTSILYYMITGESFFREKDDRDTLQRILKEPFKMTEALRKFCKKHHLDEHAVERFFAINWAKDKGDRIASIDSYMKAVIATFAKVDTAQRLRQN